jgi:tRNA-guanine family transglycosylase
MIKGILTTNPCFMVMDICCRYVRNFQHLVDGYSHAYIHHLLQTNEMLAGVLLMKHNLKQYLKFFHELRTSLKNDSYHAFGQQFLGLKH